MRWFPRQIIAALLAFSLFMISGPTIALAAENNDASAVGQAQLLLRAGRPLQARDLFLQLRSEDRHAGLSPAQVAYYIALCEESAGRKISSAQWFDKAYQTAGRGDQSWSSDPTLRFADAQRNVSNISATSLVGLLTGEVAVQDASAADRAEPHAPAGKKAARTRQENDSIPNKVRLATWLLLFGEVVAKEPELACWSQAITAIERGSILLDEIGAAIDADPTLEKELVAQPALAMRFDAAQVRQAALQRAETLARDQELARLKQLRAAAAAYRALTEHLVTGHVQAHIGNPQGVEPAYK
ncbi:MAG: hypothetical protein N2C14_03610, partial [Planctomycetales bacterium]